MTSVRRQLLAVEVPLGGLGAAVVALAFVFGLRGIPAWLPAAPLVRLGIASPLSGMTRSFVAFASGDLVRAFGWHPLGPLVFVACCAMATAAVVSWVRSRRFAIVASALRSTAFWSCAAAVFGITWIRQIFVLG